MAQQRAADLNMHTHCCCCCCCNVYMVGNTSRIASTGSTFLILLISSSSSFSFSSLSFYRSPYCIKLPCFFLIREPQQSVCMIRLDLIIIHLLSAQGATAAAAAGRNDKHTHIAHIHRVLLVACFQTDGRTD